MPWSPIITLWLACCYPFLNRYFDYTTIPGSSVRNVHYANDFDHLTFERCVIDFNTHFLITETCMVDQGPDPAQNNTGNLVEHLKVAFGSSWKEVLCEKHLHEGKVDPGSPALLVISSSALRSLELLRLLLLVFEICFYESKNIILLCF